MRRQAHLRVRRRKRKPWCWGRCCCCVSLATKAMVCMPCEGLKWMSQVHERLIYLLKWPGRSVQCRASNASCVAARQHQQRRLPDRQGGDSLDKRRNPRLTRPLGFMHMLFSKLFTRCVATHLCTTEAASRLTAGSRAALVVEREAGSATVRKRYCTNGYTRAVNSSNCVENTYLPGTAVHSPPSSSPPSVSSFKRGTHTRNPSLSAFIPSIGTTRSTF